MLNDDFFDDGAFPEYPTCYDMLFKVLKDDFTKEEAEKAYKNKYISNRQVLKKYIFV